MGVQPALPKELIESGTATFEQEIDWSGESGEVVLVDIPSEPFHIADDLDPKWEGFVQAGDPIDRGLKVTASASLDWKPTYSGSIEFDKNVGDGISKLILNHISLLSGNANFSVKGYARWLQFLREAPLIKFHPTKLTIKLGPVPVLIEFNGVANLDSVAAALIEGQLDFSLSYNENSFSINSSLNRTLPGSIWSHSLKQSAVALLSETSDQSSYFGIFNPKIILETAFRVYSKEQLKTEINTNIQTQSFPLLEGIRNYTTSENNSLENVILGDSFVRTFGSITFQDKSLMGVEDKNDNNTIIERSTIVSPVDRFIAGCAANLPCLQEAIIIFGGSLTVADEQKILEAIQNVLLSENNTTEEEERNWRQDRRLSDGEIDALKRGGENPEKLKEDTMGTERVGQFDLYKDREGNIYVKPRGGQCEGEPTGVNINDFL